MCIEVKKAFVTDKPIIAWKVVSFKSAVAGRSEYDPGTRMKQPGFSSRGAEYIYKIGETYESDITQTPGIYLYKRKPRDMGEILKIEIPSGTRCVEGKHVYGKHTINAERIKVLGWA